MTTTITAWACVAVAMTTFILFRLTCHAIGRAVRRHWLESGKESDEIWLPGDRLPSQSNEDEDDE